LQDNLGVAVPTYLYKLSRESGGDISGRCGHCKADKPLEAYRIEGVDALGRFLVGLTPSVPMLRCTGCAKFSQVLTLSGKLMVGLSWAPITLAFAAGAIYFGLHTGDPEGSGSTAMTLVCLTAGGAFVTGFMLWRVLSAPRYPVAGRLVEQEGQTYWGR
jgi:hypothetical protein